MTQNSAVRRRALLGGIALIATTASCSTDDRPTDDAGDPPACARPAAAAIAARPVDGKPDDRDIASFDGTTIRAHWFRAAAATAPTLLMGPGWGQTGETNDPGDPGLRAPLDVAEMTARGYNVLTWDPRGFGSSGGASSLNDPAREGRDVATLIDWVAQQPGVLLDAPGDPRMGMLGGSYGGSIQFVAAAADCRIDAIAPSITYNEYLTSLDKADTVKSGWLKLLIALGGPNLDPELLDAQASWRATGTFSADNVEFLRTRGLADLLPRIAVPTLLVQSTVDNLFTLDEAMQNFAALRARGVATHMIWYCGGHASCLTHVDDRARTENATLAWLDRWVKRDPAVELGPLVSIVDQRGATYHGDAYPFVAGGPVVAQGAGTLALVAGGGSGPSTAVPPGPDISGLGRLFTGLSASRAANAVDVMIETGATARLLVGAPRVALRYSGTAADAAWPGRVFAQLVDEATGLVVGNQVTPIPVTLDGAVHEVTAPLEAISFTADPGSRLVLQIVAATVLYDRPPPGGSIELHDVRVELPSVLDLSPG
jgi:ABC-2 type transport system ATP-binding protein